MPLLATPIDAIDGARRWCLPASVVRSPSDRIEQHCARLLDQPRSLGIPTLADLEDRSPVGVADRITLRFGPKSENRVVVSVARRSVPGLSCVSALDLTTMSQSPRAINSRERDLGR